MLKRIPVFFVAGVLVAAAYFILLHVVRHYADGQTPNGLGG